jgi:hypothetical protein
MAISDSQKVDLLWKKVGFAKAKTDTNSNKFAPNEATASKAKISASQILQQSSSIPGTQPASNTSIVEVYSDSVGNTLLTTEDTTATDNRTWTTGVTNWVDPSFGATYQLKVYAAASGTANPQTNGTQLFETGSGSEDQWYFDYDAGILNFIGTNLPSAIGTGTANVIYVAGAKYVGAFGVGGLDTSTTFKKSNLAAVYADSNIKDGDLVKVDDNGDGEYAFYMSNQDNPTQASHLILMGTADSSGSDSGTMRANVSYSDTGTTNIGNISAGASGFRTTVEVTQVFDGDTTLRVGDAGDADRLMPDAEVDLSEVGTYVAVSNFVYGAAADTDVNVTIASSTGSQGTAIVTVTKA